MKDIIHQYITRKNCKEIHWKRYMYTQLHLDKIEENLFHVFDLTFYQLIFILEINTSYIQWQA